MKHLLSLMAVLFCLYSSAQYQPTGAKTRFVNGIGFGTKSEATLGVQDSLVLFGAADSTLKYKFKGTARALAYSSDLSGYVPYTGATTNLNLGSFKITANKVQVDSVQAKGSGGLGLYSNSGTKVGEFGVGGGSNFDFHGFAGYDANRSSSYTVRSFTDKNYIDSSRALDVQLAGTQTITGAKTFSAIVTASSRVNVNGAADSANYALAVNGTARAAMFTVKGSNDRIYEVVNSVFTRTGLFGYVKSSGEVGVRMSNSITNNSITLGDNGGLYYNSDRLVVATSTAFTNRRIPFSNNNGLLKDTSNFNIDASGLLNIPHSISIPEMATVKTITNNNSSANQATFYGWERNQGASSAAGQLSVGSLTSLQGQLRYASSGNTRTTLANTFDDIAAEVALETRSAGTAIYPLIASGNGVKIATLGTGTVYSNSGTLTNTNPSDSTIKNTIKPLGYGLAEVLKLQPKTFYYNSDSAKTSLKYGFIAQEVQKIMPDMVRSFNVTKTVDSSGVKLQKVDKKLGLETDGIYVTLVKAIQEQQAIIDDLKKRIIALENK